MLNNRVTKLFIIFATMFFVLFPNKYYARNAQYMSKEDCEKEGGTSQEGVARKYYYYTTVCRNSRESKTFKTKDGACPSSHPNKLGGAKSEVVTRNPDYTYMKRDYSDKTSYYCCTFTTTCTLSGGKYYGASGNEVSYDQYANECLTKKPEVEEEPTKEDSCIESDGNVPNGCRIKDTEVDLDCSGQIKETELCGIISAKDQNYHTFGNDYCDIYCRRELTLTFQEKAEVLAGRYFIHSISKDQIDNLSGVITAKYECGGQIKYNTWKKDWKEANEALIDAWNDYAYWNTIVNLAPLKKTSGSYSCAYCPNHTCEVCDCYGNACEETSRNCHDIFVSGGGPEGPVTLWDYESKPTPSKKAVCENNCEFTEGSCTNPTSNIGYSSKHVADSSCDCDGYSCTLESGHNPEEDLAAAASAYVAAQNRVDQLKKDIEDCNNENLFFEDDTIGRDVAACGGDGTTTGGYEENIIYKEGYEVNIADSQSSGDSITKTCNESSDWNTFCGGGCENDFNGTGCQTETLVYYVCTGTPGQGECQNKTFDAPKNGAIYAYKTDVSTHWQSAKHYNQLFTGNITNSKVDESYMELPDYAWPVGINRKTGTYDICYEINLDDPKGRMDGGTTTCEYLVINELQNYDCDDPDDPNNYHENDCYDCGDDPTCKDPDPDPDDGKRNDDSMGVYFRAVDLSNLFPNSIYDESVINKLTQATRKIGFNWKDQEEVVNKIQKKGEEVWSNSKAELTVTLTPTAIRAIKQSNKDLIVNDVVDRSSGIKCSATTLNCTSTFLRSELSTMINSDNIVFNTDLFDQNRYTLAKESE